MKYLALSILITLSGIILSQTYSFKQYTVNNGLPTNETYSVIQNDDGHLLIGTDNGVASYDGQDFQQVDFEDIRYRNTVVFELIRDEKNRIWAKSHQHGIFILKNNRFETYTFNDTILKVLNNSFIDQFYVDLQNKLWFTVSGAINMIYTVDSVGILNCIIQKELPHESIKFVHLFNKGNGIVASTTSPTRKTLKQNYSCKWKFINVGKNEKTLISHFCNNSFRQINKAGYYLKAKRYSYISINETLLKYDSQNGLIEEKIFPSQILNLFQDNSGNLLVATRNGAFICKASSSDFKCILKKEVVSGIYQDAEDGYWFATINNGVFYLPKLDIYSIPKDRLPREEIAFISGNQNYFAVSDLNKNIYLYRKSGEEFHFESLIKSRHKQYHPRNMEFLGDSLYLGYSYILPEKKTEYSLKNPDNQIIRHFSFTKNDTSVAFVYKSGLKIINHFTGKEKHDVPYTYELFTSILSYQGNYYLGTYHGLLSYNIYDGLHKIFEKEITHRIRDIKVIQNRHIIVSTKGQGIFLINGKRIKHIDTKDGLSNSTCGKIIVQNDSVVWIGSNSGLNRLQLKQNGEIIIDRIVSSDGLSSDYIQDLAAVGKTLMILTGSGVNYLDMEQYQVREKKVKWFSLEINGMRVNTSNVFRVGPASRNLNLSAKTINLSKIPGINYLFLLQGENIEIRQNGDPQTSSFKNLPPGNYILLVDVLASGRSLLNKPITYPIEITPFFFEKTWFKQALTGFIILSVIAGVFYYFYKREQRRRRKHAHYMLQLEALSLQLSPHFLFNSLNSVLYLSLKNDYPTLNRFVTKLSTLLRKTLDNSLTSLIPLRTELDNTIRYIEMEQFRFGAEAFSFEIETDPALEPDKELVPPMILQPIVENAIWHGLLRNEGDRKLRISIKQVNGGFVVKIEDNGIGFKLANSSKKPKKNSFGLKNVERRLKLYEKMNFGKASMIITTLPNAAQGTLVYISFYPEKSIAI